MAQIARFSSILKILTASLFLSGCFHNYFVKENLSPNQIIETTIVRKPSLVKSRFILPRYDDYLEGYISGRLFSTDGKPLQGIVVKVQDKKLKDHSGFGSGVSNSSGVYKVPFSQPVIWKRIDIDGYLSFESGWQALGKKTRFRLYFNRRSGDLVFTPEETLLVLQNEAETKRKILQPAPPAKSKSSSFSPMDSSPAQGDSGSKSDDPFADFGP